MDKPTTLIIDKITNVIYPQLLQLINIKITKLINTNDRVQDGIYIMVINSSIALLLTVLYYFSCHLYKCFIIKETEEIDCEEVVKTHTIEKVTQYNYEFLLDISCDEVNFKNLKIWINKNPNLLIIPKKSNKIITFLNTFVKFEMTKSSETNVFMPIHKYLNKKTLNYEYIFLLDSKIYSQNFIELQNLVLKIFKKEENSNTSPTLPSIYELSETVEVRKIGSVSPNITFDKIFFDEKQHLLEVLDKLQNKKLYPKSLCLANKLGILLYGPPGTGKTGCISAIANLLNKHILIVNSLNLNSDNSKQKFTSIINNYKRDTIIVLDEFDYLLSSDKPQTEKLNYTEMLMLAETAEEKKNILNMVKENKKNTNGIIDMPFLLKFLDGFGNDEERLIIATTNNPDKINKILLRPGRFDLNLKLGFCSHQMFADISKCIYPDISKETDKIDMAIKKNITPLVLINKLVTTKTTDELFDALNNLEKSIYDK
jgi:ATP-dependent Zn protease